MSDPRSDVRQLIERRILAETDWQKRTDSERSKQIARNEVEHWQAALKWFDDCTQERAR